MSKAFWNGLPTEAFVGTATVAASPEFPEYWANDLVGQRIAVVKVILDGVNVIGSVDYLDNRKGEGWAKVAMGGSPHAGHRNVLIEPDSFEEETTWDQGTQND